MPEDYKSLLKRVHSCKQQQRYSIKVATKDVTCRPHGLFSRSVADGGMGMEMGMASEGKGTTRRASTSP